MRRASRLVVILVLAGGVAGFGDPAYFANKRGNDNYKQGRYEDALTEYLKAQEREPENKSIDYNLGNAYYKLGRFGDAADAYSRSLKGEGVDKSLRLSAAFNRGASLLEEGSGALKAQKTEEAEKLLTASVEQYKSLLKKDRANNAARHNLELALARLKDIEKRKQEQRHKPDQKDKKQKEEKDQSQSQEKKKGEKETSKNENMDNKKNSKKQRDEKLKAGKEDEKKDKAERTDNQNNKSKNTGKEITPEQALRIFNAIERDEKKLKEKMRAKALRQAPPTGKDW